MADQTPRMPYHAHTKLQATRAILLDSITHCVSKKDPGYLLQNIEIITRSQMNHLSFTNNRLCTKQDQELENTILFLQRRHVHWQLCKEDGMGHRKWRKLKMSYITRKTVWVSECFSGTSSPRLLNGLLYYWAIILFQQMLGAIKYIVECVWQFCLSARQHSGRLCIQHNPNAAVLLLLVSAEALAMWVRCGGKITKL